MKILPIENRNRQPNFEHAIRVSYCVKRPDVAGYEYVNPRTNKELYKKLNSRVVGWLNEGLINKVREVLEKPAKRGKNISNTEDALKEKFIDDLKNIDSDYREFNYARSVYNRNKLGFLATGNDVSIIENLKGATDIGIAKSEALMLYGTTHTEDVREICKDFDKNSKKYIAHPINRLTEGGKEVLLRLNFRLAGKDKKGKDLYEFDNYSFDKINKPISAPKYPEEVQVINLKKTPIMELLQRDTIRHMINLVSKNRGYDNLSELIDSVLKPNSKTKSQAKKTNILEPHSTTRRPRRRKVKDDPNQLKFDFMYDESFIKKS